MAPAATGAAAGPVPAATATAQAPAPAMTAGAAAPARARTGAAAPPAQAPIDGAQAPATAAPRRRPPTPRWPRPCAAGLLNDAGKPANEAPADRRSGRP